MLRKKRKTDPPPTPAIAEKEKAILADLYRTLRKMYSKSAGKRKRKGR